MSLVVNHNLMAMNAARNLSTTYSALATSTQRLSSGLRVNSAADDAAGLAIRELMRSDIAVINQGVRNAGDAISMIQTAEGAMSVIDEKLLRMKELAEQASTGTYTTAQREIMNSEYQAMAAEIDRIANATDFNGVKLLDGTLSYGHAGSGMKVHFGAGNSAAEDYYFVNMGDMRATEATGLRVGNGDSSEVWRTTAMNLPSNTEKMGDTLLYTAQYFGLQYSDSLDSSDQPDWKMYGYVEMNPSDTLTDMVQEINQGTQATGTIDFTNATSAGLDGDTITINGYTFTFSTSTSSVLITDNSHVTVGIQDINSATSIAMQFNNLAINYDSIGVYTINDGATLHLLSYEFGDVGNSIVTTGSATSVDIGQDTLSGGGQKVLTAKAFYDEVNEDYELQLSMNRGGDANQLRIFVNTGTSGGDVIGSSASVGYLGDFSGLSVAGAFDNDSDWDEAQNGSGVTNWDGADILTQSAAQQALSAMDAAINKKDTARANLGALQNRLENTITNLQIQAENLQAAESRISDVDVATEMTEFTKNNILAQAAVAMLAQANSLPQLALSLLG